VKPAGTLTPGFKLMNCLKIIINALKYVIKFLPDQIILLLEDITRQADEKQKRMVYN
jgi:hypothetical protein